MTISQPEGWLFGSSYPGNEPGNTISGFVALMSYSAPASAVHTAINWLEVEAQVDGMNCGVLRAYVLPLPVSDALLTRILEATDWSGSDGRGWRHDLSWHNTPMESPADPTIQGYLEAIHGLGLSYTPAENMQDQPYGFRLAQAVYPFDATAANLKALGVSANLTQLLGEPVDPARHALVLLTPNDD